MSDRGSQRNATQVTGGITWTKSPTTVINAGLAYASFIDQSAPRPDPATFKGYASIWPNSQWYKTMFEGYKWTAAAPGMQITPADNSPYIEWLCWNRKRLFQARFSCWYGTFGFCPPTRITGGPRHGRDPGPAGIPAGARIQGKRAP